ncbi:MAG TPA: class IV adenylate cyclase [Pyrinomonadaceae bacterium]|jgi:adenylate cyclase class 2|nr:class IV adenylate cyclase [Pyrinomonadaceae bacterium]
MAIEIEKKYLLTLDVFAKIENRLGEIGAVSRGEDFEENTIFSLQELTGKPGILRIRKTEKRILLTCKRRTPSITDSKHQVEYEVEVSDGEAMRDIILELGLTPSVVYEKRRRSWTIADAEVVLDVLPFGLYMEIEGTEHSIESIESMLEIEDLINEPRTYPGLTQLFGKQIGNVFESRFADISNENIRGN